MDLAWWIVIFAVALTIAVAWMLFGRHHGKTGGITERSMRGREQTGGEGASEASDRGGFEQHADQRGVR